MKIVTALTIAKRDKCPSVRDWMEKAARAFKRTIDFNRVDSDHPVFARLEVGRWIADCKCGGAEYVDPADPIFFCMSCGNTEYGGAIRPVVFPEKRNEIEAAVKAGLWISWRAE